MCCHDIFEPVRAPEAQPGLPLPFTDMPLTTPVRKAPCPGSSPISCASCFLPVPQSNWFQHSASQQNYSNKSHPPETKKGTPTPVLLQSLSPTAFSASLYFQVQPLCGLAWHVMSSSHRLCVYVTNKLLTVSSAQWWMSCVQPAYAI